MYEIIRKKVDALVKEDSRDLYLLRDHNFNQESLDHIAMIGHSIIMHKKKIMSGGGFVRAFCDNDLKKSILIADREMSLALGYMALRFSNDSIWDEAMEELKVS
jgi:hypothetical protein